jgi:tetrathionate reductase subunit A
MTRGADGTPITRREFLAGGALLGVVAPISALVFPEDDEGGRVLNSRRGDAPYDLVDPENVLYSACLQCNTGCGIKCKIQDGIVAKIDGNPYNPWTLVPHLDDSVHPSTAALVDGAICPKGQAGLQTAYDPYRLRKVLKRAGPRGENRWRTIPFDQAVREICDGGTLFADVAGEEGRHVEGLAQIARLRDPALASAMAKDVGEIWKAGDEEARTAAVQAFKRNHSEHLDLMIDPDHPDLGPVNNQIVAMWGRLKGGRSDFYKRFTTGIGTVNAHGHTTVCQGSLYFTCMAISEQYREGAFSGGQKFYWQADTENSEFILFVGANLFEANYGPTNRTVRLTENLATGKTRIACVDPRFSKLASKSWKWLPITPGADAALALGFIRWVLDNDRYDATFLSAANKAAAVAAGESSWTNATLLVEMDDGMPGRLIRAADHGLATPELRPTASGGEYEEKFLVAMIGGRPVAVDPNDTEEPVVGDLFVDTTLRDGTAVKSGLQILADAAREHSVEEWADLSGIRVDDLIAVARELTSHGKRVAVDIHRGPAQHTNGFYNVLAWMSLNMLLGNFDAKGGMIKPTTYAYSVSGGSYDAATGGTFDLLAQPGAIKPFGISSIRHGIAYEKTTLFDGYPARRNWYPLASDVYEEIIPSIADAYPYPVKALFLYMGAPTYALPAGHTNAEILGDLDSLPLFVANDIVVGPTSMYADYLFPDLSFLERWEFQGSHPNIPNKVQPVRQPVMAPVPEECVVYGKVMPISFEAMLLGIAEQLDLPGFGTDALGEGLALEHPDDLYLRGVANVAFGSRPDATDSVPDADDEELRLFLTARRHLPPLVFDEERWRSIVGDANWRRTVHVLNRGGRFEAHEKAWTGDRVTHAYGSLLNMYQEKTATTIHAGTGVANPGVASFLPIRDYHGREPDDLRSGHDLAMITHRTISQTKSRTVADPWLSALMPENGVLINANDVDRLGLSDGQLVTVTSATNPTGEYGLGNAGSKPMVGRIVSTQGIRPGVISFALGFGHWATGAVDIEIDGQVIEGEPRRRAGIHANAAMWVDPSLGNTCMLDPVGGSVSFYDTHVRLVPVAAE